MRSLRPLWPSFTAARPGKAGQVDRGSRSLAMKRLRFLALASLISGSVWLSAGARVRAADAIPGFTPSVDDWGEVGLMDVPVARMGADGDFHFTYSDVAPYQRYAIDATALPWLEAGFRYTAVANVLYGPVSFSGGQSYKDRAVSIKVRLAEESSSIPEISLGLRDLAGTGLFGSEYLVATRRFYNFDMTAGIGWGLMGTGVVGFNNPLGLISHSLKVRPASTGAGTFALTYFRGPRVGLFGGIEYHTPWEGVRIKLELDSNDYKSEPFPTAANFAVRSPLNFGVVYSPFSFVDFSAGIERGTTLMARVSLHANFNTGGIPVQDTPPPPVQARANPEPPAGRLLDNTAIPQIAQQPGLTSGALAASDRVWFEPSGVAGLRIPSVPSEPPVGRSLAETSIPQISGTSVATDIDRLFDGARDLGYEIDDVAMDGNRATLHVTSRSARPASAPAQLARLAFASLPGTIQTEVVDDTQGSPPTHRSFGPDVESTRSVAPASQSERGRPLAESSIPKLDVTSVATDVTRLFDGAYSLGYAIDDVAIDGDVTTLSVSSQSTELSSAPAQLAQLAFASLPGTARTVVVDAGGGILPRRQSFAAPAVAAVASVGQIAEVAPIGQRPSAIQSVDAEALAQAIFAELDTIGFKGIGFAISGQHAYLAFSQSKYREVSEAIGRAARVVARHVPPVIEVITLDVVDGGLTTISASIERTDFERAVTEQGSPEEIWAHAKISGSDQDHPHWIANHHLYPEFTWSLTPQVRQQLGGPNSFYIYQLYADLSGEFTLSRGFTVGGDLGANLANNLNKLTLPSDSVLPHVRSDIKNYLQQGKNGVYDLQTDYLFDIAPNWYGRLSGGYLEAMFGGVDSEVLYRPFGERWAVGLDVNHVAKRDFNELFGFQSYQVTTGHLSLYYQLPFYNLLATLRVGRYLAGDKGATVELSRTFDSGIRAGVFATGTNVSGAQFGEGSFDKGFFLSIPLDLFFGTPTRSVSNFLYRPLTRDGGQMLGIKKPLYDQMGGSDPDTLTRGWHAVAD